MVIHHSGARHQPPVSYLFVDAGNLNAVLREAGANYFNGNTPTINWSSLRANNSKVYYYDAIPVPNTDEDENAYAARTAPKRAEQSEISRQPRFHVRNGDVKRAKRKRGNEQKMVDVQLAVDAIRMAHLGLFSNATFVLGDLDFKPLIDALVEIGIHVTLYYPPRATASELIESADEAYPLTIDLLKSWLDGQFAQIAPQYGETLSGHDFVSPLGAESTFDDRFGRSYLWTDPSGNVHLEIENSPMNPMNRCAITGASEAAVLNYLKERFGAAPNIALRT